MPELTQSQLENMVVGKTADPNVVFYEQSRMNPELSKQAGKRIYETRLMIKKTAPGVTDFAAYAAQDADIKAWPQEYELFMNTKSDIGSPGINILPGLDMDTIQELRDYGLTTITKLCAAKTLPAHLQPAQDSALRLNEALKDEKERNDKKDTQAEAVPAPDRQVNATDDSRRVVQAGTEDGIGDTGRRPYTGGCVNGSQAISDNWSIRLE